MPKAANRRSISRTAPTRRTLLSYAASATMAASAPPAAAPNPDMELIGECVLLEGLIREYVGLFEGPSRIDDDHQRERYINENIADQDERMDRLTGMRATTMAGVVALFRVMLLDELSNQQPIEYLLASCFTPDRLRGLFMRGFVDFAGIDPGELL